MSITSAYDTRNESYSMQYLNWQQAMKQELQAFMEMVDRFLDLYLAPFLVLIKQHFTLRSYKQFK
jgi:hypothetical protein